MNSDNMEKLAKLLIRNAHDPAGMMFDIGAVVGRPPQSMVDDPGYFSWKPTRSCGTRGCAMGLAAVSGEFEGLEAKDGINVLYHEREQSYMDAGMSLFGISAKTAAWLFYPDAYSDTLRTGKQAELEVARRLRHVIANGDSRGEFDGMVLDANKKYTSEQAFVDNAEQG